MILLCDTLPFCLPLTVIFANCLSIPTILAVHISPRLLLHAFYYIFTFRTVVCVHTILNKILIPMLTLFLLLESVILIKTAS
jgi:hypothetical protein